MIESYGKKKITTHNTPLAPPPHPPNVILEAYYARG